MRHSAGAWSGKTSEAPFFYHSIGGIAFLRTKVCGPVGRGIRLVIRLHWRAHGPADCPVP